MPSLSLASGGVTSLITGAFESFIDEPIQYDVEWRHTLNNRALPHQLIRLYDAQAPYCETKAAFIDFV